jgi:drug/metabolite transporter (DMT)-like permease
MQMTHRRAVAYMILAAALFSTGGAAIKWAHFSGWQIAGLRAGIAGATLLAIAPAARRGWGWRPLLVGVAYAVTCICFVLANRLTTSANAIFIQSTGPLYVLILGPLLLHERVTRRDVLAMLPIAAGLLCFFLGSQRALATAPDPAAGNLVAGLSGVSFAFLFVGLRWLGRRGGIPVTAAAIGNLLAFLVTIPLAFPVGPHAPADWAVLGYLGVVQIGVAYFFVSRAMCRLTALEATMLLLIEPMLNPIWSWLVHGEVPGRAALLGALLILIGTVGRSWLGEREKSPQEGPPGAGPAGRLLLTETQSPH